MMKLRELLLKRYEPASTPCRLSLLSSSRINGIGSMQARSRDVHRSGLDPQFTAGWLGPRRASCRDEGPAPADSTIATETF
jgi:hypothetical protein